MRKTVTLLAGLLAVLSLSAQPRRPDAPLPKWEGLAETPYLFATYDRNLYYGTDMEDDKEVFDIK